MAVNIKTFVRAGGLYPGGFNGVTLLFQTICDRFFDIAVPFSPISLALNAIPAIISFKAIGKKFTVITSLMIVATIAIYFAEKKNKDVWNYILLANAVVLLVAGYLFGWDKALYSIIFQYASTQMIHLLYQTYKKVTLFVITDEPEAVYQAIYEVTNHSATEFTATGMYSNEKRKMIYSVVSTMEAKVLTQKVMEADPHAFVNVVKTDTLVGRFYQKETY